MQTFYVYYQIPWNWSIILWYYCTSNLLYVSNILRHSFWNMFRVWHVTDTCIHNANYTRAQDFWWWIIHFGFAINYSQFVCLRLFIVYNWWIEINNYSCTRKYLQFKIIHPYCIFSPVEITYEEDIVIMPNIMNGTMYKK